MVKNAKDPAAIVLPFGKHRGSTVAELLTKDPGYAEWILNQGWVAEKFAELHAALLSRGAQSDDSPEHNAIQVRFLDEVFRTACLLAAVPMHVESGRKSVINDLTYSRRRDVGGHEDRRAGYKSELVTGPDAWEFLDKRPETLANWIKIREDKIVESQAKIDVINNEIAELEKTRIYISSSVVFERRGVDVVIRWSFGEIRSLSSRPYGTKIEIKPTMGDDFPSVMRQMAQLEVNVLVLGEYSGRAVSEPQLRQMFAANGQTVVFVRDIEAEIPNARAELAS